MDLVHLLRCFIRVAPFLALSVLTGCAALSGHGQAPTAAAAVPAAQTLTFSSPAAEAQFHVLAGETAAGRGDFEAAAEEFLAALDTIPNAALAARATKLAVNANRADLAIAAAQKWSQIDPSSLEAHQYILQLSLLTGHKGEAFVQADQIVRNHPGGIDDGLRSVASMLSQMPGDGAGATDLMVQIAKQWPNRASAYRAVGLVALHWNDPVDAADAAKQALRLEPNSKESVLLMAAVLIKQNRIAESRQLVDHAAQEGHGGVDLRLGYAQMLLEARQNEPAEEELQAVLKAAPDNVDAQLAYGLVLLEAGDLAAASRQFDALAKRPEHAVEAAYFSGRIDELRGQPAAAILQYEKVNAGKEALDAAVRRAALLIEVGQLDAGADTFDHLRDAYPQLAAHLAVVEGDALAQTGHDDDAAVIYEEALKQAPDDEDLLYGQSLILEREGHIDAAEANLRHVLAHSPNDPRALNALGYMMVDHAEHLDEAKKLIGRALEMAPNDPAIMDSMGWAQFKTGNTTDSLTWLQKAFAQFPDAEIGAHLGEVLWTLDRREEAQKIWAAAQKTAPDDPVLAETLKRLNKP
jgi:tetratricopeptide (TPR) repeat protein